MTGELKPSADLRDFIRLYKPTLNQELVLLGVSFIFLIFLRFEAILQIQSHYLGGFNRDAGLYVWLTRTNLRDLWDLPWFNTHAFYPYGKSLAWSDNYILPALISHIFMLLGFSFITAYNCTLLLASLLCGYLTSRLCFMLANQTLAALVGGLSFMGLSYFSSNLGHPQLQFAFWLPLALIAFFRFIEGRSILSALSIGLCIFCSFLCTVYYSIFVVLTVLAALIALLLQKPLALRKRDYAKLFSGLVIGLVLLLPFFIPYLQVQSTFGTRGLYEMYYFSANILSYSSTSPFNWLYGYTAELSHDEAQLFGGVLLFIAAAAAFIRLTEAKPLVRSGTIFLIVLFLTGVASLHNWAWANYATALGTWLSLIIFALLLRRVGQLEKKLHFPFVTNRNILGIFLFVAILAFLLSFGPQGNPEKGQYALALHRLFYEAFPGFSSLRAISRIGLLSLFCCCVLFSLMLAHFGSQKKYHSVWIVLISLFALLENWTGFYPLEPEVKAPPIFSFMEKNTPQESVAILLPMTCEVTRDRQIKSLGDYAEKNVLYMNWMVPTQDFLINGHSGQYSKLMRELPGKLSNFPDTRSLATLSQIAGLKYIIYLKDFQPNFQRAEFLAKVSNNFDLKLIHEDQQGNFLFEYAPMRDINQPNFQLLAPAYGSGELNLELMTLHQAASSTLTVKVSSDQTAQSEPFAELPLPSNGQWKEFPLILPSPESRVRPHRLSFKADSMPIYLRTSKPNLR